MGGQYLVAGCVCGSKTQHISGVNLKRKPKKLRDPRGIRIHLASQKEAQSVSVAPGLRSGRLLGGLATSRANQKALFPRRVLPQVAPREQIGDTFVNFASHGTGRAASNIAFMNHF